MLPKTLNTQKDNAAKLKVANCPLEICRLRIVMESGAEECLMESVRSMWSDPNAEIIAQTRPAENLLAISKRNL